MPIGKPQKSKSKPSAGTDPRTGVFYNRTAQQRPPVYKPAPDPPKKNLDLSSTRDLNYFHSIAAGEYPSDENYSPDATLVLNLFRGTETHLHPIAERLVIGPAQGTPYYYARATPTTTSAGEYNTIIVSRRHPLLFVGHDVCVGEVRPNLDLFGPGLREIGTIRRGVEGTGLQRPEVFQLSWANRTGSPLDGVWSVWKDGMGVLQFFEEGGFRGLDDDPPKGCIKVKRPLDLNASGIGAPLPQDPRMTTGDLAYLDFQYEYPLFVSSDPSAHELMDVIVAGLFMMLTVATRKAKIVDVGRERLYQATGVQLVM